MAAREPNLPIDSDIDLDIPAQRVETHWPVVVSVSAGGVLGALARYGIGQAWPTAAGGFPWATFVINVTGCLLIGALMVLVTDLFTSRGSACSARSSASASWAATRPSPRTRSRSGT